MDYKALYQEQTANIRWKEHVELVPVDELWKLRDFDRRIEPKADQAESNDVIEKMKDVLRHGELREALVIDYFPYERRAYVSEGNHRLAAARELGMRYLPATVQRCSRQAPPKAKPVRGVEADEYGYVPADLMPSQIGVRGCVNSKGEVVEVPFYSGVTSLGKAPQPVSVRNLRHQLKDAEFAFGKVIISYDYTEMDDVFELVDFDEARTMFRDMRREDRVNVSDAVVYRFIDQMWNYLDVERTFSPAYTRYLQGKLGKPGATARELYEELSSAESSAAQPLLHALVKACKIAVRKSQLRYFRRTMFETGLEGFYGRPVYLEFHEDGYDSYVLLEMEQGVLDKIKSAKNDDRSLHTILRRDMSLNENYLHYDLTGFTHEDVDYTLVHEELQKAMV